MFDHASIARKAQATMIWNKENARTAPLVAGFLT
jgi:hypothetical protein